MASARRLLNWQLFFLLRLNIVLVDFFYSISDMGGCKGLELSQLLVLGFLA